MTFPVTSVTYRRLRARWKRPRESVAAAAAVGTAAASSPRPAVSSSPRRRSLTSSVRRRLPRGWWTTVTTINISDLSTAAAIDGTGLEVEDDALKLKMKKRAERRLRAMRDMADETFVVTVDHLEWVVDEPVVAETLADTVSEKGAADGTDDDGPAESSGATDESSAPAEEEGAGNCGRDDKDNGRVAGDDRGLSLELSSLSSDAAGSAEESESTARSGGGASTDENSDGDDDDAKGGVPESDRGDDENSSSSFDGIYPAESEATVDSCSERVGGDSAKEGAEDSATDTNGGNIAEQESCEHSSSPSIDIPPTESLVTTNGELEPIEEDSAEEDAHAEEEVDEIDEDVHDQRESCECPPPSSDSTSTEAEGAENCRLDGNNDGLELKPPECFLVLPVHSTSKNDDGRCCRRTSSECAICMLDYDVGDVVMYSKYCRHAYHQECIVDWFSRGKIRCPSCRSTFWVKAVTADPIKLSSGSDDGSNVDDGSVAGNRRRNDTADTTVSGSGSGLYNEMDITVG